MKIIKGEPTSIDTENYNISIYSNICWYREQNIKTEKLKNWLKEAGEKLDIDDSEKILNVSDNWFIDTWGYVARMFVNDCNLRESDLYKLTEKIKYYIKKSETQENRIAPIEKVKEAAAEIMESITDYLDNENFNVIDYINKNIFTIGYVRQMLKNIDKEKYPKHYSDIENWLESNKKKRKIRKKKQKSEDDIVKLFKCCKQFENLIGVEPTEIIGKECVVVYHTQKKNITFYFGKKLNVHRSMITGFDEKKSKQFEAKKETLKELNNSGKITVDKVYKEVYNEMKEFVVPTGRVTDKMIILGKY